QIVGQKNLDARGDISGGELGQRRLDDVAGTILYPRFAILEKLSALHHVDTDISAGVSFDRDVATKAAVSVPTGFDCKFITTNAVGPDACLPAIITNRVHARAAPFGGIDRTPQQ